MTSDRQMEKMGEIFLKQMHVCIWMTLDKGGEGVSRDEPVVAASFINPPTRKTMLQSEKN